MAFSSQTFTVGQVLTAAQMNQVDSNIDATRTCHKGAAAPANLAAGVLWLEDDNPSATSWYLKQYDGTDWIILGTVDSTANTFNAAVTSESATSGVIETDGTYVAVCKFGPALDGVNWDEKTSAPTAKVMLATIKDAGADTTVQIWSGTVTPIAGSAALASVTLTGAATPTSIAASMGYIIVGSEDGIAIIDPHSGAWAERTAGWPRSLSTSTTPALTNNDVESVCAGLADQPAHDPRTGGPLPTFGLMYGTGVDAASIIKTDGAVYEKVITAGALGATGCAIADGRFWYNADASGANHLIVSARINTITADDWAAYVAIRTDSIPYGFGAETAVSVYDGLIGAASAEGLSLSYFGPGDTDAGVQTGLVTSINRTYNTGFLAGNIKGAWLANSKTADRTFRSNTLTQNGTVTEAAVETGAELKGYSGFSASNYLTRAADADWNSLGTASAHWALWVKSSGPSATEVLTSIRAASSLLVFEIQVLTDGTIRGLARGASAQVVLDTDGANFADGNWHKVDFVQVSSTMREIYVDGVLNTSNTTNSGSLTGTLKMAIGVEPEGNSTPATSSSLSQARLSATAPTATQVRQMYDAEKGMFVANAKCLLQSATTDAVLDVDIDAITGFVTVVQTDDEAVWKGLAIHSEPAIPTGGTTWEHSVRHAGAAFTITDANFAGNVPAIAVRDVASDVQGLMGKLPAGVDLSKAKALIAWDVGYGGNPIISSMNIQSVSQAAGVYTINFAIPFKSDAGGGAGTTRLVLATIGNSTTLGYTWSYDEVASSTGSVVIRTANAANAAGNVNTLNLAVFGELENE